MITYMHKVKLKLNSILYILTAFALDESEVILQVHPGTIQDHTSTVTAVKKYISGEDETSR